MYITLCLYYSFAYRSLLFFTAVVNSPSMYIPIQLRCPRLRRTNSYTVVHVEISLVFSVLLKTDLESKYVSCGQMQLTQLLKRWGLLIQEWCISGVYFIISRNGLKNKDMSLSCTFLYIIILTYNVIYAVKLFIFLIEHHCFLHPAAPMTRKVVCISLIKTTSNIFLLETNIYHVILASQFYLPEGNRRCRQYVIFILDWDVQTIERPTYVSTYSFHLKQIVNSSDYHAFPCEVSFY